MENIKNILIVFLSITLGFIYVFDSSDDLRSPTLGMSIDLSERRSSYIHLVFIGHSRCPFSNGDEIFQKVRYVRDALIDYTRDTGTSVMTTGVAVDKHPIVGINYLKEIKVFEFDQIMAGSGLYNEGLYQYGINMNHSSGTPQLLILATDVEIFPTAAGIESKHRSYEVLASATGFSEIQGVLSEVKGNLVQLR